MPSDPEITSPPSPYDTTATNHIDFNLLSSSVTIKSSIRDLEQLVGKLRRAGDNQAADRIDQIIMSLLEKKIFKKLVTQRRTKRRNNSSMTDLTKNYEISNFNIAISE